MFFPLAISLLRQAYWVSGSSDNGGTVVGGATLPWLLSCEYFLTSNQSQTSGDVAQCLPGFNPQNHIKLGVIGHAYNPGSWEVQPGGSESQGHLGAT